MKLVCLYLHIFFMQTLSISYLENLFKEQKETHLFGKWITLDAITPLYKKLKNHFMVQEIGVSEENRPIYSVQLGTGTKKILIWSQMHGNESTGTKAVFDLLNCFSAISDSHFSKILKKCTILIVPMLNPDGALRYTRINAKGVDLNRDAVDRKAKESKLLRAVLEDFNPQFCFNLHDQRTIFGVEGTKNPATLSFLAPSEEETRSLTKGRKATMNVIVAMYETLKQVIPNQIGRYTDEFYPTATGDNFQKLGYNTILIESGHYPNDYEREESRKYSFFALITGIYHIASVERFEAYKTYFEIPNNVKIFYDVIHRYENPNKDVAYQYVDTIKNKKLISTLDKKQKGDLLNYEGHYEILFKN